MDYNEFNFLLLKLKTKIYDLLLESKLPLGAIFYLIKDIHNNLQNQYMNSINQYSLENSSALETKIIKLGENKEEKELN